MEEQTNKRKREDSDPPEDEPEDSDSDSEDDGIRLSGQPSRKKPKTEFTWPDLSAWCTDKRDDPNLENPWTNKPILSRLWDRFLSGRSDVNHYFHKFHIYPIKRWGTSPNQWDKSVKSTFDVDESPEDPERYPYYIYDVNVFDSAGTEFPFRLEFNPGCADANTGAWGTLRNRDTRELVVMIEDAHCDSTNRISFISCTPDFEEFDDFPDEDELEQHQFLVNQYDSEHQLEKITAVLMTLHTKSDLFVPMDIRIKFQFEMLKFVFRKIFPLEVLQVLAQYSPALIHLELTKARYPKCTDFSLLQTL